MRLRHFSFALCTTSWLLCFCANGQEPSAGAPSSAAARICAEVRQLTGDPLTGLRSADFAVSGDGAPLPFRLIAAGAQVPMSLLVIVSPAAGFHTLQAATASLTQIVPHRNQVDSLAFLGPRGEYVGFRPVDEALSNLKAGTFLYKGYVQAIQDDLEKRSGERAILFLTNRLSNPPPDLIRYAQDAGALIYAVGGDPDQNYTVSGQATFSAPLGNYTEGPDYGPVRESTYAVSAGSGAGAPAWERYAVRSIRTVYMERSLQKALVEMSKTRKGFYELGIDLPASTRVVQLTPKIPGEYQLHAYPCSTSGLLAIKLTISK